MDKLNRLYEKVMKEGAKFRIGNTVKISSGYAKGQTGKVRKVIDDRGAGYAYDVEIGNVTSVFEENELK
jgi:ribosomal protein L24